jgi:glycine/D-amino acid oxidase-like deaminating enzyme
LGVRIVTHASVERIESATIELATDKGLDRFGTRLVVVASGYASARFATKLGLDMPPLRFWRSHLLLLPRFERHRVFSLDPGDVAVMNHQSAAIVGLNEDAQHIPEPATETDVSAVNDIRHAFRARFGTSASVDARPVACVKVDVAPSAGAPRSLAPTMFALSDNIIAALPGKMSEAPYVADRMVPVLARQLGSSQVAARPCDHLLNSEREWWSQE